MTVGLANGYSGVLCVTEMSDSKTWVDMSSFFNEDVDKLSVPPQFLTELGTGLVHARVLAVDGKSVQLSLRAASHKVNPF